jgi:alkyl hydroperoxide reductase subunit AhpC
MAAGGGVVYRLALSSPNSPSFAHWQNTDIYTGAVRKIRAAQYVRAHPGEVCPAAWEEGAETLAPSIDLVGKI